MNEQEINKIIGEWRPMIENLANQWQNTITSREDLIQEGLYGILRGIKYFDPNRNTKIETYIFQCIKSQIICSALESSYPFSCPAGTTIVNKQIRNEQSHKAANTRYYSNEEEDTLCIEDKRLQEIDLEDYIESLDPKQIAKMHFMEGMSQKDLADKFGVSIGCISKYLSRFRDLMWKKLKEKRSL